MTNISLSSSNALALSLHTLDTSLSDKDSCFDSEPAIGSSSGNSEKLIGDTIKNVRENIFLISKAGYIQGSDIDIYCSSSNSS